MLEIILPYPSKELMPNRKNGKHWGATVKAKDDARDYAYYATLAALRTNDVPVGDTLPLIINFIASDKRKRDLDNLLSSAKGQIDGVARALKIDDSRFEPITIARGYDKTNSCMQLKIGE